MANVNKFVGAQQSGKPSIEAQQSRIASASAAEKAVADVTTLAPAPVVETVALAPASVAAKVKRARKASKKVAHALATGENTLREVPSDYNPRTHKGIKRSDMASDGAYLRYKAWRAERRAALLVARATDLRSEAQQLDALENNPAAAPLLAALALVKKLIALEVKSGECATDVDSIYHAKAVALQSKIDALKPVASAA